FFVVGDVAVGDGGVDGGVFFAGGGVPGDGFLRRLRDGVAGRGRLCGGLFLRAILRVLAGHGDVADRARRVLEVELRVELGEILQFGQRRQLVQAPEPEVVEEGLGG